MKNLDEFNMKSKKPWEVEGIKWRDVTLKEITLNTEKINPKNKNPAESFLYLDISNIDNKNYKVNGWRELTWKNAPSRARKLIKSGDIVFATTRPYLKNIAIVPLDLDNQICSTGFCVLRPNTKFTTSKWIFYNVIRNKFVNYISSKMRGTSYPAVLDSDIYFSKIPLPFRNGNPDLETQKKIVEYIEANFSRIDKILEKKKKELEQLDELWESVLEQVFKPKEGEEWKEMRLGEVCIINPKKSEVKQLLEQNIEVSFIPMDYVDDTEGKIVRQKIRSIQSVYKGYTYFKEGDVLFAKITPCMENGKSAIACNLKNRIGFGSTEFHVLRPKESILSEFIFYFIRRKRFRNLAKLHFTGTVGHKRVPKEFLINSKIPLPFRNSKPDIEKQKEIANYLDNIYEKIKTLKEKNQNQIAQLEKMKESILDEVFNHENK